MPAVKLNAEQKAIVKQAIANIKAKPDQFDMSHWYGRGPKGCGSSACLAGHLVLAAGIKPVNNDFIRVSDAKRVFGNVENCYTDVTTVRGKAVAVTCIQDAANKMFDGVDTSRLFHAGEWPEPFHTKFFDLGDGGDNEYAASTPQQRKKRAALAIRRLRHFLKTGE